MEILQSAQSFATKSLKGLSYTIIVLISLASAFIFYHQNKLLYINFGFPVPMLSQRPDQFGVAWRDVFLETEDGEVIHGWLLHSGKMQHSSIQENIDLNVENDTKTKETVFESRDDTFTASRSGSKAASSSRSSTVTNDSPQLGRPKPSSPFTISSLTGKSQNTVMIYFHGNAGDVTGRIRNLIEIRKNIPSIDATLIIDYRGYGRSTGSPSEKGLMTDARSTLRYVKEVLKADKIIVFGRSLGGAVSLSLQDQADMVHYIDMMILENTFTQISDMIHHLFPKWISWVSYLCWNKWKSINRIGRVNCPLLLISGLKDEIVPAHMMKTLFKAAKSKKKSFLEFPNGTHNDTFTEWDYYIRVKSFIEQHL